MAQATRITISATTKAPVALVWKAWNEPEAVKQWNAADPSWHCPSSENDLRVGGKFRHRMEARDGSFGFDFEGVYNQVELHKEISYTMPDGRKVSTFFTEKDGGTYIESTFDPETENDPEFQRQGWQAILNNFIRYVESIHS
jgi:uncharacterized protein YndB with AHSA1/START domain